MYYFIVNTAAGHSKVVSLMNRLKQKLLEKGIFGEMMKTTTKGDASHLARIAIKKGYSTVVAIGGDGTVHEVLNGIAGTGTVLGIIPLGSENRIAKSLGISLDWKEAIDDLAARSMQNIDIGKVQESKTYFLLSGSIGLGVELVRDKFREKKSGFLNLWGSSSHIRKTLLKTGIFGIECVVDRTFRLTSQVYHVSVLNSGEHFSSVFQSINNDCRDGLLDLVLYASDANAKRIGNLLPNKNRSITVLRGKEIHLDTNVRMDVQVDGQIVAKTPVTFRIASFGQKVIVSKAKN